MSNNFQPSLSPRELLKLGAFGGTYFTGFDITNLNPEIFEGLSPSLYQNPHYDRRINLYNIKSGKDYDFWVQKGWIHSDDPAGWFHWYCKYYYGRRHPDDSRQIQRWLNFTGPHGRWRNRLMGLIYKAGGIEHLDNPDISPKIRQSLLHWAFKPTSFDYQTYLNQKSYA